MVTAAVGLPGAGSGCHSSCRLYRGHSLRLLLPKGCHRDVRPCSAPGLVQAERGPLPPCMSDASATYCRKAVEEATFLVGAGIGCHALTQRLPGADIHREEGALSGFTNYALCV